MDQPFPARGRRVWIRNLMDDEIVTGHFSWGESGPGNWRSYFLAEPRIYGASLRHNFSVP
jgi:hypothetical protein